MPSAKLSTSTAFLALAVLLTSVSAQAMPRLGRSATGAVRTVDRAAQTLTIAGSSDPQPQVYRWNNRARFFAGGSAIAPAAIPRGATIAYIYHTPVFGERFVTKVTVLHPLPARGKSPTQRSSSHAARP